MELCKGVLGKIEPNVSRTHHFAAKSCGANEIVLDWVMSLSPSSVKVKRGISLRFSRPAHGWADLFTIDRGKTSGPSETGLER